MIFIDGIELNVEHFNDATQRINNLKNIGPMNGRIMFDWKYESDEELITLYYIVNHFREHGYRGEFMLRMPFVPNGRMDRVKSNNEVFTLKWFAKMINDMGFCRVTILDPHSNVAPALINNVIVEYPITHINRVLKDIKDPDVVLYYPDYGACKKYSEILSNDAYCFGKKVREWETGKIVGLEIENEQNLDLEGKTILMVDDIVSFGGTMYYGAKKLKEMGAGKIFAYATHTENSVLDEEYGTLIKALNDGTVERLFTTDSLFRGKHEKIFVMKCIKR